MLALLLWSLLSSQRLREHWLGVDFGNELVDSSGLSELVYRHKELRRLPDEKKKGNQVKHTQPKTNPEHNPPVLSKLKYERQVDEGERVEKALSSASQSTVVRRDTLNHAEVGDRDNERSLEPEEEESEVDREGTDLNQVDTESGEEQEKATHSHPLATKEVSETEPEKAAEEEPNEVERP